ncbi:hypothetical protein GN244_ATG14110 [Phytophthora infestans]|uniref:Uncharacterized protein n=1 Tax=Phytophthora infestans TaxID=4787 RepID=A0A833SFV8_PHYIN|nr:hypothetical protein GN244_ATG14110 [Phytophthora infestans]
MNSESDGDGSFFASRKERILSHRVDRDTEKASISSSAAKITPQEIKTHAQFTFSRGGQAYSSRDYVTYNELPGIRHCQYPIMSCRKNVCPSKTIAASKGTLAVYSLCRSR